MLHRGRLASPSRPWHKGNLSLHRPSSGFTLSTPGPTHGSIRIHCRAALRGLITDKSGPTRSWKWLLPP